MHLFIGDLNLAWLINLSCTAPIVFEEVHSPVSVCFCILLFVPIASSVASARFEARRGVNSVLEATAVNVVSERFHVGKAIVGLNATFRITLALPAIIEADILVSGGFHSVGDHRIDYGSNIGFCDLTPKRVPGVPSEGRGSSQFRSLGPCSPG